MREFHDAIIVAFQRNAADLDITIEGATVFEGDRELGLEDGRLEVRGLKSLTEEGEVVALPDPKVTEAKILELEIAPTSATLLVEWRTYQPRAGRVMNYVLEAASVEWLPSGPVRPRPND